jgi:DNA invertase Pin-like site-specific DNA recombinase
VAIFGYARVSSQEQDLSAQDNELRAAGCAKVYREKVSGAKAQRAELLRVINRLEPGDVLTVTRLDRLARSTRDLLNLLNTISERGASFRSLRDTWADTTNAHGRLIITVLGGLAEFERELIRSRCGEGMVRAKERGVRFGRPRSSRRINAERRALGSRLEKPSPTSRAATPSMPLRSEGWRAEPPGKQFGA